MKITIEEVQYIAKLAKLRFTQEEAKKMAEEFDIILEHFQLMDKVKTNEVPSDEREESKTSLRKDKAKVFENIDKLFQNTKRQQEGYIQVPKIIE